MKIRLLSMGEPRKHSNATRSLSYLMLTVCTDMHPLCPVHTAQCRQSQLCIDWMGMAMVLLNNDSPVPMTDTSQQ